MGMVSYEYLCDRIGVGVLLLPEHAHQIAHDVLLIPSASLHAVKPHINSNSNDNSGKCPSAVTQDDKARQGKACLLYTSDAADE